MFCGKCGTKIIDGDSFCTNCGAPISNLNLGQEEKNTENENTISFGNATIGDTIKFGKFKYQIDQTEKQVPIEWIVLDIKDSKLLLLSKNGLCTDNYDENYSDRTGYEYVNWEECPLRKRLNNDFLNATFGINEQKKIVETEVINNGYSEYTNRDGKNTFDKIFLLSINEVKSYFKSEKERKCYKLLDNKNAIGWWLRTTFDGITNGVNEKGKFERDFVPYFSYYVRPAMWVKI